MRLALCSVSFTLSLTQFHPRAVSGAISFHLFYKAHRSFGLSVSRGGLKADTGIPAPPLTSPASGQSCLSSLGFSFFLCEMGHGTVLTDYSYIRDTWVLSINCVLSTVPGAQSDDGVEGCVISLREAPT